ncbi:MAG: PEP-CTERM sorting domain-containing protein [Parvularculaceae bacterium]
MPILFVATALFFAAAAPAAAATTVFAANVYASSGNVANLGDVFGAPNGVSGRIGNPGQAGQAVFGFLEALSGADLRLTAVAGGGATPTVFVSIGEIVGGVAVYSAETSFTGGAGVFAFDFSARCALISATGCSLVRVRTTGGAFRLDAVSGVGAAPEPAAWALMLLGFGGVSWRMKQSRRAKDVLTIV